VGEGPIYVLSDGKAIKGTWRREFNLFPIEFYDLDGNPITLNPGNTWVELPERIPTPDDPTMFDVEVEIDTP
jgi:hypothetical protein